MVKLTIALAVLALASDAIGDLIDVRQTTSSSNLVITPPASSFFVGSIIGAPAQTRTFDLTLTERMGAPDGVKRPMLVVNGQYPGPIIEVNQHDRVVVNVHNQLANKTSIHWHGLFQNGTNWFDGTAAITECGTHPGNTLTYNFTLGGFSGTTWYHSHFDLQYTDGVVGPLIVHPTAANPPSIPTYDQEFVIQLSDWYHLLAPSYLATFLSPQGTDGLPGAEPVPDTGIINGVGQYNSNGPYFSVTLNPGKKYRLRLVHTGSFPSLRFSIDNHPLTVIEADGTIVTPVTVAGITMGVAQRYSVIISTTQAPALYWIRNVLDQDMYGYTNPGQVTDIRGIIRYSNFAGTNTTPANISDPGAGNGITDLDTTTLHPATPQTVPAATRQYTIGFEFDATASGGVLAFINNISWVPLNGTTTLLQVHQNPNYAPEGLNAINQNTLILTNNQLQTVDLVVNNLDNGPHPFHLHGHQFWVMGSGDGTYANQVLTPTNPLSRDTQILPAASWTVIRFVTDNPGVWSYHCHIAWHIASGLLLQLIVQPNKITQFNIPASVTSQC